MVIEVSLGTVKTYGSLSGYTYLHIPQHICKQFNITPSMQFSIIYKAGKIVIEQAEIKKEE